MRNQAMQEMNCGLKPIIDHLLEKRSFDFSGYQPTMLAHRIGQRLAAARCKDFNEYLSHVKRNADEIDKLVDVITINVSRFFRDTLTFELLADIILPVMVQEKIRRREHSLRIWSAGCAMGEEPFSVAILIHEMLCKERLTMDLRIFATDIDVNVLKGAARAVYSLSSIENIKHRLLNKYFIQVEDGFGLVPEIKELVTFSHHDMLDKKRRVPPESIFGDFDLVLCRNLLIYYNVQCQEIIFSKLYHSFGKNGVLVLGRAEAPTMNFGRDFRRVVDFSPIYRKKRMGARDR